MSFSNCSQGLLARISTNGNFMMFLVFLVLFWLLLFGLSMFRKWCAAMLVGVLLLCLFCVKISTKKPILCWGYFPVYILYARQKKTFWILPLCYVVLYLSLVFEFHLWICYWCLAKDPEIVRVNTGVSDGYIKETRLLVFIFKFNRVFYRWILFVQHV